MFDTNGKNCSSIFILIYRQCFKFYQPCCKYLPATHINTKNEYEIKVWQKNRILFEKVIPIGNYMFKVSNSNTRTRCEICSKLTMKKSEQRQWRRSGLFIVNFEHISHLVSHLVFLMLTLSREIPIGIAKPRAIPQTCS